MTSHSLKEHNTKICLPSSFTKIVRYNQYEVMKSNSTKQHPQQAIDHVTVKKIPHLSWNLKVEMLL
jgi:hypothetical protein